MGRAKADSRGINLSGVAAWVDTILAEGNADPEASHGSEDDLLWEVATYYAPPDIVEQLERLQDAGLVRWYS